MQKRKYKINVLDIVIVIVLICAATALIFRDTITEFFAKPEIVVMEVTVSSAVTTQEQRSIYKVGNTITVKGEPQIQAVVTKTLWQGNSVTAVLSLNGYTRFGRLYMENGNPLTVGEEYTATLGENQCIFSVKTAKLTV